MFVEILHFDELVTKITVDCSEGFVHVYQYKTF